MISGNEMEKFKDYYKGLEKWAFGCLILAVLAFALSVFYGTYAINLFTKSVKQGMATTTDLLHGLTYTYITQMVITFWVVFLAFIWRSTVKGIAKRISRLLS